MSWDVELLDADGRCVQVERHIEGGTYALGGTSRAELNVTYNYGARFREAWPERLEGSGALRRMLDGRRAGDTLVPLAAAVAALGIERSDDYWQATDGNAGYALHILLGWARENPEAVWSVE